MLDRINTEDEEFMQLLVDKLDRMVVTWQQPWYQQSNRLSRPFTETNDETSDDYRKYPITKKESDRIAKRWKKFCKEFDVPDKLLSFARWKNKYKCKSPNTPEESVRRFVTAYLARGLKRNMHQVYKHIMTHFGNPVKGPYSPEEEKLMDICFHYKPKYAVLYLSLLLGREPRGIYKRLQQKFTGKLEKKRLKWTLSLATKFFNLLLQYSECSVEELKYRKFEKSVWLKLEKELDQHYAYLQHFWYDALHVQIFVKKDVKINKIRKKVFKILKNTRYQVWRDIRWKELLEFFPDGFTHTFLYKLCINLFRGNRIYATRPLPEVIDFALNKIKTIRGNKRYVVNK
ncbi:unnamed protein product, partial [Iphiclides podalirius]